jgi:predicted amidohydrolase
MDCRLGDIAANLAAIRARLAAAADRDAKFVVFPECALTGYGFASRDECKAVAQTIPGPAVEAVADDCDALGIFAAFGLIERDGDKIFNACALVGPRGLVASYRKIHLPFVGADRWVDPGDRPFAVHDLGGLRVGLGICFDASFPEAIRVLTLAGADVVALPTNWSTHAKKMAELVCRVRALENHVYFMSVNRVGDETGFHYIGHSSICDYRGDYMTVADHNREAILTAAISPGEAREKKWVGQPGEYEIDRVNWRRPAFYGRLVE